MMNTENTVRADQDEVGSISLEILHDADAESPREWDNLGTMVCSHRRYNLGDGNGFQAAKEIVRGHYSEAYLEDYDMNSQSDVYQLISGMNGVIVLPLYLYDHSGITMRTTPFSCPWDSGQVGYIFITKQRARDEYGWKNVTKARVARIEEHMRGEVETYDQYLRGDIYGFLAKKDDDVVDSCWGFYGDNPLKNGMIEHLDTPYAELARTGDFTVSHG